MPVIARALPTSNPTRRTALKYAKTKRDNSPVATDVLRASTIARLDIIAPAYEAACKKVDEFAVDSAKANADKDKEQEKMHLLASHYITVMNLAIKRGEMAKEDRLYYELDINSDALPYMESEGALQQVAENIVTGDAARVAAGGVAMSNPTVAQVAAQLSLYSNALIKASEATDKLDHRQEILNGLNVEADEVILKVWDEVESYFNNEEIESKRANAREWGVVYLSTGASTAIQLTIISAAGLPVININVKIKEGKGTHTTDNNGKVDFNTTLNGTLTLVVGNSPTEETNYHTTIDITEGVPFVGTIHLP